MPYALTRGSELLGIDAFQVTTEVNIAPGQAGQFTIVGLPDASVRESRERVKGALVNCGYTVPFDPVTVALAPADLRKEGPALDLPIALGLLGAQGVLPGATLENTLFVGELGLDGSLRPVRGALARCHMAAQEGLARVVVPLENAAEGAHVRGAAVYGASHLRQVVEFLLGKAEMNPAEPAPFRSADEAGEDDLADVRGQHAARRALEIAAAGGHNLLLMGPPGTGKSMLAKRLRTILPPLTAAEALECTRIHSAAGQRLPEGIVTARPFRSPHHTVSPAGLAGGTANPQPGEISLAHRGVLFLDELTEFPRGVLEVLRQPLEDTHITVARAARTLTFPAGFMLVAASNPCPCGWHGSSERECRCTPLMIQRYRGRISGPLLDRIDLHVEVPAVPFRDLQRAPEGESSASVRARVLAARERQSGRQGGDPPVMNARLARRTLSRHCALDGAGQAVLEKAMERLGLSARAHDRILRVARTIADLAGEERIGAAHVAEAVQFRVLDRSPVG